MKLNCGSGLLLLLALVCVAANSPRKFATINTTKVTAAEGKPAKKDAAGNWGEIVNGVQLSLRFTNQTFKVGEPVVAAVLWRNRSSDPIVFSSSEDELHTFDFIIKDRRGKVLQPRDKREHSPFSPRSGSSKGRAVDPGSQLKFEADLTKRFTVKPGKYRIMVNFPVRNATGTVNVCSSETTIQVVRR